MVWALYVIIHLFLVNLCFGLFPSIVEAKSFSLAPKDCRPDLIKMPKKTGMLVVGELSGFDPCHSSVSIKIPDGSEKSPIFISIHGGGGKKDAVAITEEFYRMNFATLEFDAFKMNGFERNPVIGNASRQKMLFKIASQAHEWVVKQPQFDSDSVFIYGISNGASVALNLASSIDATGVVAEAPTPIGIGYPNTISVPTLIIFGKSDDFAAPLGKKRWQISGPCRFNLFLSEAPEGTAKLCNYKLPDAKMATTLEWIEGAELKEGGVINVKYIEGIAHAAFYGPLTIQTRADFYRARNIPVKPFMEKQGWSTGGQPEGRAKLLQEISDFVKRVD